ncbi:DUF3888 domain-containing protein [Metabacillus fastidiosus]|uniref:DUF3888 domain-containing protein n=1 Tax=Metabacillus fastidiosus TaxID=1458 RepID=UPI003D28C326
MGVFSSEITKSIRENYKTEKSSGIGYSVEKVKVTERTENDYIVYDVLFNIKTTYQDENELRDWNKDTLKFAVKFDEKMQTELVDYKKNGWQ